MTPFKDQQIRNRKNDDATSEAEAKRKLAMLMDRLNGGADFAQVATDYSEDPSTSTNGGDLGYDDGRHPHVHSPPIESRSERNHGN